MNAQERKAVWEGLNLVEDWLSGGARRERVVPDFEAAAGAASTALGAAREPCREAGPGGAAGALAAIAAEVRRCAKCRLASSRTNAVAGEGVVAPLVLVVGEGPGSEEDATGRPFVGPAGQLLDRMLGAVGLSRSENCYIANVVKCRPPGNRDPAPDEQAACLGYLRAQAAALRPRALLCVGRVSAQALLGTKEGIGRLRGVWREFDGIPLISTYHPSAILRDESLKRPAWEDLKRLRDFLAREPPEGGKGAG